MPGRGASDASARLDQRVFALDRRFLPNAGVRLMRFHPKPSAPLLRASKGTPMTLRLLPALLLGIATVTLGPVACNAGGDSEVAAARGSELGILPAAMDT